MCPCISGALPIEEEQSASGASGAPRASAAAWRLWEITHPSMFNNCTRTVNVADDNVTQLVRFVHAEGRCTAQDPLNEQRCHWRVETQTFEGCGCDYDRATHVTCACNHATDFSLEGAAPKVGLPLFIIIFCSKITK